MTEKYPFKEIENDEKKIWILNKIARVYLYEF